MSRIYVHFSTGSKIDAVSLDRSIHFSKFDAVKGRVKAGLHEEAGINKAIQVTVELLHAVAADLPESEFKDIKKLYLERKAEYRQQESERRGESKVRALPLTADMKKQQADLKIQQKIEALQQKLSKLQEQQEQLKSPFITSKRA
ncbi:hypothetical protein WG947_09485 [Pontibacter sp. H259]|uniref:hypothetical protein n=1 Tax=Pontibacter sp. H259 TaxID=3133421 RepID=UPI0030C40132